MRARPIRTKFEKKCTVSISFEQDALGFGVSLYVCARERTFAAARANNH